MSENANKLTEGKKFDLLANAVQKVMDDRKWSVQQAAIFTGVNQSTIFRMKRGITVEAESLIQFGRAVAEKGRELENARLYLKFGGKTELVSLMEEAEKAGGSVPVVINSLRPTGERIELLGIDDTPVIFEASEDNLALIAHMMRALEKARLEV